MNYYHIISLSKISKLLYIMEFKDFLIKYTTISKNFIEDFHNIIKEDYFENYYDF